MSHQDFEEYAEQRRMQGGIADKYVKFFVEHIDYKNPELKILDFGCGDGRYFSFFKRFFKEENIYGVEVSKTRVERCKSLGWANAYKVDRLQTLPFNQRYFDCINFDQVIEHISHCEIGFYLSEFTRVLKDDGKLILITPNYPIKQFYDIADGIRKMDWNRVQDDPTHIARYNFRSLKNLLSVYFRKVELEPTGAFLFNILQRPYFSRKIIGIALK